MTTQTSAQFSLFQRIATFFTTHSTPRRNTENIDDAAQPTGIEVVAPLMPPTHFLTDDTEGEEPADLALVELIPAGLSAFNLPHCTAAQSLDTQIGPACLINACRLEDRPLTETEMEAADLAELIPAGLSKLDIARAKAALAMKEVRVAPQPLPDLSKLQKINHAANPQTVQSAA